ncbi:cupin domain-containing protein [Hymenobacter sp. ASUV-10]|uniref:Cupin domain-containing protein n=1 Tax=Hymenobacter aranciens TaxID=3063996 RepID=A0ABT9B7J7_9BACT|nr:cupin domain-containing protein [Hymenobacter sp. ASUV-10]MDO7874252.1 cupin domain-containing protein [Hymenobacter sp. ASUV-10]
MKTFVLVATILFGLTTYAQTAPKAPAKPTQNPFPKGERAPAANFTGTVYLYPLIKDEPAFNCTGGSVTFEPGARSHWHRHPAGQILLVTEGLGYYQEKGQPVRLLRQGEVVKCQPGVEHWHGASPQQAMTHIALNVNTDKGIVNWGRAVTDQEYRSYK